VTNDSVKLVIPSRRAPHTKVIGLKMEDRNVPRYSATTVGYRCSRPGDVVNHMDAGSSRSDVGILGVGCYAPVDTVSYFVSRPFYKSLVSGRYRLSLLSRTEPSVLRLLSHPISPTLSLPTGGGGRPVVSIR
jgi:hypothetical protein